MLTIKLSYQTSKENKKTIINYQKNQNNIIKFSFNRIQEDDSISQKQLYSLINSKMNNIFVDSWFIYSAIINARAIYASAKERVQKSVIFGSKKLFLERCQHKISKEDFQEQKFIPLYIVGEKLHHGNRKVAIDLENNKILLKLNKQTQIELIIPKVSSNNHKLYLKKLDELTKINQLPLTFSINQEYIFLTFDELKLTGIHEIKKKNNRIMSLDLNPNYVGYSIINWVNKDKYKIVKTGMFSLLEINKKENKVRKNFKRFERNEQHQYLKNKRNHEIVEVIKKLVNIAKSHNVESFSVEKLKISPKDHRRGKKYNRLCNNNWNKNLFRNQLVKRLKFYDIKFYEVLPQYSSFIGNLLFRSLRLPDQILSSIEMNRRTFMFVGKFIKFDKSINRDDKILFPSFCSNKKVVSISLEEIGYNPNRTENWKDLYGKIKTLEIRYRVSLAEAKPPSSVFRLNSLKSLVKVFNYEK